MALAVAIGIVLVLVGFMLYAIARERGPAAPDVAIGYERAWDELNFGLLWDLSGEELRDGLRRDQFIAAKRAAYARAVPRGRLADRIDVDTFVEGDQTALVVTRVAAEGTTVRNDVLLERRREWMDRRRLLVAAGARRQGFLTTARQMAGVLLTGGESRRMGTAKAQLVVNGETLAARSARVLGAACDPVIEVGLGVSGLPAVREDPPGAGPLVALLAGVGALGDPRSVVCLACDLPNVSVEVLRLLVEWPGSGTVVPVVEGRFQYACARYGPSAFDAARASLHDGLSSLRGIAGSDCEYLTEADWGEVASALTFADVDTPEDLKRLGL